MSEVVRTPRPPWDRRMEHEIHYGEGKIVKAKIRDELEIDRTDLDGDMKSQPERHAWYRAMQGHLDARLKSVERRKKDMNARLNKHFRKNPSPDWEGKRPTKDMVEAEIRLHPDYQNLLDTEGHLVLALALVMGAVEGFRDRKDMLLEMSRRERQRLTETGGLSDREETYIPNRIRKNMDAKTKFKNTDQD